MNSTLKNIVFWVALFGLAVLVWSLSTNGFQTGAKPTRFSEFVKLVEAGQVQEVTVTGNDITGLTKANGAFRTYAPDSY